MYYSNVLKVLALFQIVLLIYFLPYIKEKSVLTVEFLNKTEPSDNDLKRKIESYNIKQKIGNISACIFYGRKMFTEILFRYLDSNLKINGGILDKIVILMHLMDTKVNTNIESDFLKSYLSIHREGYELVEFNEGLRYKGLYSVLPDDDLIFKIDDDIVFIANGTFENMVDEYLKNDHLILSANVINHHTFSRQHAKMDLMKPFIINSNFTLLFQNNGSRTDTDKCKDDFRNWKKFPYCGAIAHESFLYNVYKNDFNLSQYNFSLFDINKDGYHAWRINFILFRGKIVNKMAYLYPNETSDEYIITKLITKHHNRHSCAFGSTVVSHFSYSAGQYEYLRETNILEKYKKLSYDYFDAKRS